MKRPIILAFILSLGILFLSNISINTGITKMAVTGGVYWTGADGNTYLKEGPGQAVTNLGRTSNNTSSGFSSPSLGIVGAQKIADPNPPRQSYTASPTASSGGYSGGGGTSGGSGGYAAPVIDRQAIAQFDQSIGNTNAAINRLGAQQASGNSTIDASYQNALNQLLGSKNQANAAYDTNVTQNKQDYIGSKNTIRSNAGSSLNGLLRLLGSKGAGGGSAATITAPGAVARQATQQQTQVGNTFGHNSQDLDTNWNNYLTGYNNQVSSAGNQRDTQRQSLQQQIDNNKASLLQQLAQLSGQRAQAAGGNPVGAAQPYIDQANAALDRTANYTTAPITYQTQAYNAPSLSSYTFNPSGTPTYQGQPQTNDYTSPYLAALLGRKQQQAVGA